MSLQTIRDTVASLLSYSPGDADYEARLNKAINDAQTTVLGSHRWSFAEADFPLRVYPDVEFSAISVTSGNAYIDLPGLTGDARKDVDGHTLVFTSSAGVVSEEYTISWADTGSDRVYLTKEIGLATASYTVTVKYRQVNLPARSRSVEALLDLTRGTPVPQRATTKFQRDISGLDPKHTGPALAWIPSEGIRIPAPRAPEGVATAAALGQGVRKIVVYETFTWGGRESALSSGKEYSLTNLQTLTFTPPAISAKTGFYRKYYFTCPAIGLLAPRLISDATTTDGRVDPDGGVTISPDLSLTTLQSEDFFVSAVRYGGHTGAHLRFNLYPHPSSETDFQVRVCVTAPTLYEDADEPLIPADQVQTIELEAAASMARRLDNPALAKMLREDYDAEYRRLVQGFLVQTTAPLMLGGWGDTGRQVYDRGPLKVT